MFFIAIGVLLRRLQCDSELAGVSHVFVDEIHERDLNSDFLLIILRRLIRTRKDLKLVLMSATLNAELFAEYFDNAPVLEIPGRTFPVQSYFLEDALQHTKYRVSPSNDAYLDSGTLMKRQKELRKFQESKEASNPLEDKLQIAQAYSGGLPISQLKKLFGPKVRRPYLTRSTRNHDGALAMLN